MQCGFGQGTFPHLRAAVAMCSTTVQILISAALIEPVARRPSTGQAPPPARAGAVSGGFSSRGGLWALLVVPGACRHGWLPTWIVGVLLFASLPFGQAVREAPALYDVGYDSTLPCAVAWCYELACQNTHFCTTEGRLMRYFAQHAPFAQVRVALWLPLNGPVYFDVCRDATPQHFGAHLRAAGHDPRTNVLHVAFDTASTVVEILSVPGDETLWWIVRDAVSRELLRPVAPWYGEGGRVIATLNSHGQAAGLTYSQEAAELHRIPQGARGVISTPLQTVFGYLTRHGLVLMEAVIGASSGSVRSRSWGLVFLMVLTAGTDGVWAMQQHVQMQVAARPAAHSTSEWSGATSEAPTQMRVWTYTLEAPLLLEYDSRPDPRQISQAVVDTRRGLVGLGDLVWAYPRIVSGVAHLLQVPLSAMPTTAYWLMQYRSRATVLPASPGQLDWQYLAQAAFDSFGDNFFHRGQFGIFHNGAVINYGTVGPYPSWGHPTFSPHRRTI